MTLLDDLFRRGIRARGVSRAVLAGRMLASLPDAQSAGAEAVRAIVGDDQVVVTIDGDGDHLVLRAPTAATGDASLDVHPATTLRMSRAQLLAQPAKVTRLLAAQPFEVESDDLGLIDAWIDDVAREALPQLWWVSHGAARCAGVAIAAGHVLARVVSTGAAHLAAVADVVATLATRPARLARELERLTGGRLTSPRWGLGDAFAIELPGGSIVDFVRPRRRLQTRVRVAAGELGTPAQLGARIRDLAAPVRKLAADKYELLGRELAITVDGVIADRERLADLLALAHGLVGETAAAGPYR